MAAPALGSSENIDRLLKHLLILSRATDHLLEDEAVKAAVREPLAESKVRILRLLGTRESQTATQIAHFLDVSRAAVSQLIDSMVRRKLVIRRAAPRDRRTVDVRLTPKGQATYEAVRCKQRDLLRRAATQVPAVQANRWNTVLEQVTAALAHTSGAPEAVFDEA